MKKSRQKKTGKTKKTVVIQTNKEQNFSICQCLIQTFTKLLQKDQQLCSCPVPIIVTQTESSKEGFESKQNEISVCDNCGRKQINQHIELANAYDTQTTNQTQIIDQTHNQIISNSQYSSNQSKKGDQNSLKQKCMNFFQSLKNNPQSNQTKKSSGQSQKSQNLGCIQKRQSEDDQINDFIKNSQWLDDNDRKAIQLRRQVMLGTKNEDKSENYQFKSLMRQEYFHQRFKYNLASSDSARTMNQSDCGNEITFEDEDLDGRKRVIYDTETADSEFRRQRYNVVLQSQLLERNVGTLQQDSTVDEGIVKYCETINPKTSSYLLKYFPYQCRACQIYTNEILIVQCDGGLSEYLQNDPKNQFPQTDPFTCNSSICLNCSLQYLNQVEQSKQPITHCGLCGHCLLIEVNESENFQDPNEQTLKKGFEEIKEDDAEDITSEYERKNRASLQSNNQKTCTAQQNFENDADIYQSSEKKESIKDEITRLEDIEIIDEELSDENLHIQYLTLIIRDANDSEKELIQIESKKGVKKAIKQNEGRPSQINRNSVNFLPLKNEGEITSRALLGQGCETIEARHSELQRRSLLTREQMLFPVSEDKHDEEDFENVQSAHSRASIGQMTGLKPKILVFDSPEKGQKIKYPMRMPDLNSPKPNKQIAAYSSARTAETSAGNTEKQILGAGLFIKQK